MTIGDRIKNLRKKNDLTQEKLADFLGVSYQAVSKWENGITCPDLSLIRPLTKLLHVTADELLGIDDADNDRRKAELDAMYEKRNDSNLREQVKIAKEAVNEYPGEMKFLYWFAECTYMLAFEIEDDETFRTERENALKMYRTVFENADDEELKRQANADIVMALSSLGRWDEAKAYAEVYPESPKPSKETVMSWALSGAEKRRHEQEQLRRYFELAISGLTNIRDRDDPNLNDLDSLLAAESLIRFLVPDGNYLDWYDYLFIISIYKAQNYQYTDPEKAVACLREAREYAEAFDKLFTHEPKKYTYTSPLFDLVEIETKDFLYDGTAEENRRAGSFRWWLSGKCFDPLREREDFQAL